MAPLFPPLSTVCLLFLFILLSSSTSTAFLSSPSSQSSFQSSSQSSYDLSCLFLRSTPSLIPCLFSTSTSISDKNQGKNVYFKTRQLQSKYDSSLSLSSPLFSSTSSTSPENSLLNLEIPAYRKKPQNKGSLFLVDKEPIYSKTNRKRMISISCLLSMSLFYIFHINHILVRLFTGIGLSWIAKEIWWKTFELSNATRKSNKCSQKLEEGKNPIYTYFFHLPFIFTTGYLLYVTSTLFFTKIVVACMRYL